MSDDRIIFRATRDQHQRLKELYKNGDGQFKTMSELMRRITEIGLYVLEGESEREEKI